MPAIGPEQLADLIAERVAQRLQADRDRLLDLPELAERLKLSPRGVTGLVARGELPPGSSIGGVRRWFWPEVLKFLAARRRRGGRRKGRGCWRRRGGAGGARPAVDDEATGKAG